MNTNHIEVNNATTVMKESYLCVGTVKYIKQWIVNYFILLFGLYPRINTWSVLSDQIHCHAFMSSLLIADRHKIDLPMSDH